VADTPGHEQYTRNMITGASTADLAILLVDASHGLVTQTRRHAYLVSLVGIKHVVLAVNKMDSVDYQPAIFEAIRNEFVEFARDLGFSSVHAIPLSALRGDNIVERSARTSWYDGPTLMGLLDTVTVAHSSSGHFALPIQYVNRPNPDFRGVSGTVVGGAVSVGDEIRITESGQTAQVAEIVTMDGPIPCAAAGEAVTLRFDREIDASRGDVICLASMPLEMTDQFEATIIWMHEESGLAGRSYELKIGTQWATASITGLKYRVDINNLAHVPARTLGLNDIAVCTVALTRPVVYDSYAASAELGSFILVDRLNNATVAAGLIRHTLRRAENVHRQLLSITRQDRERLNGHPGKVIWFTGLSGAGKSTLANALEVELFRLGQRTYLLDGDNVRQGLNRDLGFTDADRVENIRRIAEVSKLMADAGMVVLAAFISPFRRERALARELIGADAFVEVYVSTSLQVCERRDAKGLYGKARMGKIPNMTGINSPYEAPDRPDVILDMGELSVEQALNVLKDAFRQRGDGPNN
jgi:bifunctional enzyme CysN/CysC